MPPLIRGEAAIPASVVIGVVDIERLPSDWRRFAKVYPDLRRVPTWSYLAVH